MEKVVQEPTTPAGPTEPQSAFELFGKSKDLFLKYSHLFVPLYVLPALVAVLNVLGNRSTQRDFSDVQIPGMISTPTVIAGLTTVLVVAILFMIANFVIEVMLTVLELKASEDKQTSFGELWHIAKKYLVRYIGLSLLIALVVVAGLIAFVIPGVILLRRYFLAPYILIEHDTSISEAMQRSAALTKPYSWSVYGIFGVFLLISLLSIVPIIGEIATFILAALYSIAPALRYRELAALARQNPVDTDISTANPAA